MLKRAGILLAAVVVFAAVPTLTPRISAQGRGGMGMMPPAMSGMWNPVVGAGATYEMTGKDGKKQLMTVAIVSKEDADGKSGFWMEYLINANDGQQTVMQMLMVRDGESMSMPKMIIQAGGRGPMEISGAMMGMMASRGGGVPASAKADVHNGAELVGAESVTTPAGTFDCEHLRTKEGSDVWIAPKTGPWGLVKSTSKDSSMTLVKVFTDAKSHIVGTPQSMDSMMGGRGRGQD
jgi:hypothetical protein